MPKITSEDMDDVRAVLDRFFCRYSHDSSQIRHCTCERDEQRDIALALILGRIYDRGYNQALRDQDEEARALAKLPPSGQCPYTFAHTRHWCGYDGCRDS